MDRVRRAFTFSNLIACLALFVALGGSVYAAAKIDGKQIRKSSLPGNRLKPKTITPRQVKPKSLTGRQVKRKSLKGRQIDQRTLTEVSAAALASVHYESATASLRSGWTKATATCPAGMYAIGGGATLSDNEGRINESGPSPLRTGWTASGFGWFSSDTTMTVTAICVAVRKPGERASTVPGSPIYQPTG